MRTAVGVILCAFLLCACAVAQEGASASQSSPLLPGQRMVQAVQYPYDQKVKFDHLFPTGRIKDISGSAEVLRKKENVRVQVDIDAPPASQLKPEYQGYVAWAVARNGEFTNLGSIEPKGTLKTTTNLRTFGFVISAEADLKATSPTDPVLESGMPDAKRRLYPIYRVIYTPAVK
jgi:hypothetical protein